jgi:hypothetical protein
MLSNRPSDHTPRQEDSAAVHNASEGAVVVSSKLGQGVPDERQTQHSPTDKQQPEMPVARVLENTQVEKYREWYDAPAALPESGSASGGSTGPPLAAPVSYPIPPAYYPMPWIPYTQQGPYQMSYYGPYSAYPVPGVPMPPYPTTPPASDASGPVAGPHPWPGMMYNVRSHHDIFGDALTLLSRVIPPISGHRVLSLTNRAPLLQLIRDLLIRGLSNRDLKPHRLLMHLWPRLDSFKMTRAL